MGRVVDHLGRGDRPAWSPWTAGRARDRARRINRIFEGGDVACALALRRRDPSAAFEHDQEVVDSPVAQRVAEDNILADQLVALRGEHDDAALSPDLARLPIPHDLVRREVIAVARHAYGAGRCDDVGAAVVSYTIGAEFDRGLLRDLRSAGVSVLAAGGGRLGL